MCFCPLPLGSPHPLGLLGHLRSPTSAVAAATQATAQRHCPMRGSVFFVVDQSQRDSFVGQKYGNTWRIIRQTLVKPLGTTWKHTGKIARIATPSGKT